MKEKGKQERRREETRGDETRRDERKLHVDVGMNKLEIYSLCAVWGDLDVWPYQHLDNVPM